MTWSSTAIHDCKFLCILVSATFEMAPYSECKTISMHLSKDTNWFIP